MTEPRTRRLAVAMLGSLVVVLVVASGALFFQGGDNQTVRIILPTPGTSSSGTSAIDESSRRISGEREVRVYVSGAVRRPGVYLLSQGDRLEDALAAAGGGTSEADLEAVNLALRVQDEGHYRVPIIGETPDTELKADSGLETSQGTPSDTGQSSTGLIDLNSASMELLETLPGIGPVRAKAIVADRELKGPFLTVEQITRVAGVGAGTYMSIRDLVRVDGSP